MGSKLCGSFYSGPDMLLPVPNRGFDTFSGPLIGLLGTPSQARISFQTFVIVYRTPNSQRMTCLMRFRVQRSVINPASEGRSLRIRSRRSFWRRLSREGRPGYARARRARLPSLRNAWCHRTTELSDAPVCMAWPLRDKSGRPFRGDSTAIFASLGSGACLGVSCPIIYNIPG